MSKLCQGPSCHVYDTTDRKRGPKGNKRNQTRTVGGRGYGNGDFCTLSCQDDWWKEYGTRAVDYFGRLTQPRVLQENNAWIKRFHYSWGGANGDSEHYYLNTITREQRPITEQQYNDDNYTLNTCQ